MVSLIFFDGNEALGEKNRFIDERDFLFELNRSFPEMEVVGEVYEENLEHGQYRVENGKKAEKPMIQETVPYYVVKVKK